MKENWKIEDLRISEEQRFFPTTDHNVNNLDYFFIFFRSVNCEENNLDENHHKYISYIESSNNLLPKYIVASNCYVLGRKKIKFQPGVI